MRVLQQHLVNKQVQITWLKPLFLSVAALTAVALTGCASKPQVQTTHYAHAPNNYTVRSGDTLSGIAARYGLDYLAVARLNNIPSPYTIYVNQSLKLKSTGSRQNSTPPIVLNNQKQQQKTADQIQRRNLPSPNPKPSVNRVQPVTPPITEPAQNGLQWLRPSNGPVIQNYSLTNNIKGVRFGGEQGDPIFATAAGQVVYADDGLKEFGNLILIRHSNGYISAYAHNSKMLVKSGQAVSAGQKIAEMGSTGANRVMLEFQIRSDGKPIDPMLLLAKKS